MSINQAYADAYAAFGKQLQLFYFVRGAQQRSCFYCWCYFCLCLTCKKYELAAYEKVRFDYLFYLKHYLDFFRNRQFYASFFLWLGRKKLDGTCNRRNILFYFNYPDTIQVTENTIKVSSYNCIKVGTNPAKILLSWRSQFSVFNEGFFHPDFSSHLSQASMTSIRWLSALLHRKMTTSLRNEVEFSTVTRVTSYRSRISPRFIQSQAQERTSLQSTGILFDRESWRFISVGIFIALTSVFTFTLHYLHLIIY